MPARTNRTLLFNLSILIINIEDFHKYSILDGIVKSLKKGKCHAELVSASNKIKHLRDPETSSG